MTTLKFLIFIFMSLFFVSCSSVATYNYSEENKILSLKVNEKSQIKINLTKPIYRNSFDSCVMFSHTVSDKNIEYGNLFIEDINLDQSCVWNGLATSFFESDFKDKLKLSNIEVVEEFDIKNYNFKTYLINNKSYMNLILIFGAYQDTIILDYNGKLYDKVLKSFKPDYTNKYLSQKRFISNYHESLVRNNMFNGYFGRESESEREP